MEQLFKEMPAPALAKGLVLLEQLAVDGHLSLERIAARNRWPKSSTLRYLLTLEKMGAVKQHPDTRHWQALKILHPLSPVTDYLQPYREQLPELADRTGHCAELYHVDSNRVKLIDRADPETGEIVVAARIGFERGLTELDSTAALYFGFTPTHKPPRRVWVWKEGEKQPLTGLQRKERILRARENSFAVDVDFNEFGIRRFAIPLLTDQHLQGILAIAQRQTPRADKEVERIHEILASVSPVGTPSPHPKGLL
ncbi:MAG: helix-turn-helix domain-containing protein [Kiritimatiellae bacterium]|jgi:DNA-binding IclR family transcriptional regulator|nr:helix-turn-helix domain-containing protein [Kiritimatiellia bacterium]